MFDVGYVENRGYESSQICFLQNPNSPPTAHVQRTYRPPAKIQNQNQNPKFKMQNANRIAIGKAIILSLSVHSQSSLFSYHDAIICSPSNRSCESIEWQQLQIGDKRGAAKIASVHYCQTNFVAVLVYFDFIIAYNDKA